MWVIAISPARSGEPSGGSASAIHRGHGRGLRVNRQRRKSPSPRVPALPGLKNRFPSQWSLAARARSAAPASDGEVLVRMFARP